MRFGLDFPLDLAETGGEGARAGSAVGAAAGVGGTNGCSAGAGPASAEGPASASGGGGGPARPALALGCVALKLALGGVRLYGLYPFCVARKLCLRVGRPPPLRGRLGTDRAGRWAVLVRWYSAVEGEKAVVGGWAEVEALAKSVLTLRLGRG